MISNIEKAQLMLKLARSKGNWGAKYDRVEHFKRFPNRDQVIKELSKTGWILIKQKPNYIGISLNNEYKKEIIEFITKEIPYLKELLR